jgi:hypothetical protein
MSLTPKGVENIRKDPSLWSKNMTKLDLDALEVCGGDIQASVLAVDEPYYGGSSASLEVNYRCDRCGQTKFDGLPDAYSISDFLTAVIAKM